MCGRYVSPDTAAMERAWHIGRHNGQPFKRRFNVLPTTDIPILRAVPGLDGLDLCAARWGFIPVWWQQDKPPSHCFNARSEEAANRPMWRDAWKKSRCLIPAEGWYEWQAAESTDAVTGEIKAYKQPHYITAPDGKLIAFAGLLSMWGLPDHEPRLTCAIITRAASASVSDVHDRMPVALPAAAFDDWLNPNPQKAEAVAAMIEKAKETFRHHAVSTRLNSAKTDEESLTAAV
jgi:putative SOS response-associated peptidase YedK